MGSAYQNQTTSGYNASPPPDDGSTSASNKITWAGIKTKLADVLNTFAANINSQLRTALNITPSVQTGSYTTTTGDHMTTIEVTGSTTISLGDAAAMIVQSMGYQVTIFNKGVGVVTVALITNTNTLNGTVNGAVQITPQCAATFTIANSGVGYEIVSIANTNALNQSAFNQQTGTTYQVLSSDFNKILTFTNAGAITVTLADPAVVGVGQITLKNIGATTVTVNRKNADVIFGPGLTQAGVTSFTLPYSSTATGLYNVSGVIIASDGTNWTIVSTLETHGQQSFIAGGTFTAPAGVTTVWLTGCASGGAGGGCGTSGGAGGGGGAGQMTFHTLVNVVPGTAYTVTIGAASTPGAAGNNPGGNGNTTSFGGLLSLTGGTGGSGSAGSGSIGNGGAGGDTGTSGGPGMEISTAASGVFIGGIGGGGLYGGTVTSTAVSGGATSSGQSGRANSGAGGTGGATGAASGGTTAGAAGGSGYLLVEW